MTVLELIRELVALPHDILDSEVFSECPETGYSWSVKDIVKINFPTEDGHGVNIIIRIGDHSGPQTPEE